MAAERDNGKGLLLSGADPAIAAKALELFVGAAAGLGCGVVAGWAGGRVGGRDRGAIMAKQAAALRGIDVRGREGNVPVYIGDGKV
ncbi:MAG: hypothetical protein LBU64_05270 [Planctomycetota bacterium]|nr:hypothetical protein [Planctomycetota bacterium]